MKILHGICISYHITLKMHNRKILAPPPLPILAHCKSHFFRHVPNCPSVFLIPKTLAQEIKSRVTRRTMIIHQLFPLKKQNKIVITKLMAIGIYSECMLTISKWLSRLLAYTIFLVLVIGPYLVDTWLWSQYP